MENIIKKRTLKQFGVEEKGVYRGQLHKMFEGDIKDAIDENKLIAVIGQFGSGKSTLFDFVEQELAGKDRYQFVHVQNTNKEKLTINNITDAILFDVSREQPNRSMEARSRQVQRVVGDLYVNQGKRVCVVIENAHRLHPNTLMAVKDIREKKWLGHSPLFSVALVGQTDLRRKLARWEEVLWRCLVLDLEKSEWMNFAERVSYLETVYGRAIEPIARDRIAMKTKGPLEIEFLLSEKMDEAARAGKEQIDSEVISMTPSERVQALGISYQQLADKAGVAKSTAHDVVKGAAKKGKDEVEAALAEFEQEITGKANAERRAS